MVTAIFRSRLREDAGSSYRPVATRMLELARSMPGFIDFKSFRAEDGERVSLIEFESLTALEEWRDHPEHLKAQRAGREQFYSEYRLQLCESLRAYYFDGEERHVEADF